MKSLEPVILTWVEADISKEMIELPSFSVQRHPRDGRFVKFIEENSPDKDSCSTIKPEKPGDWHQLWCLRNSSVMVLMWKNQNPVDEKVKDLLHKWVLSHD